MRATLKGTRYDTDDCRELASFDYYSSSNNYAGKTRLMEAGDGNLLVWTKSNGHDCYLSDSLSLWDDWKVYREYGNAEAIDLFDNIEDEDRLVALGLITICPKVKKEGEENG